MTDAGVAGDQQRSDGESRPPTVQIDTAGLAAIDVESIRQEGPRIDNRIGLLLNLLLGGVASAGGVGGVGGLVSRQQESYLAMTLLIIAGVVLLVGLMMIAGLILPQMHRNPSRVSHALTVVSNLPDIDAAEQHYLKAGENPVRYLAQQAFAHSRGLSKRNWRFRRAGIVLMSGVLLAGAGFGALIAHL